MNKRKLFNPFFLPVLLFAVAIVLGTFLLRMQISWAGGELSWVDALFTATSATCVTGLVVVDTGSFFSGFGQMVILILIQLGGLGIMTYAAFIFYIWRKKISIADNLAIGQSLIHKSGFRLGKFLQKMVLSVLTIELLGALYLYWFYPQEFPPFCAVFHAVSAFCNAGFSLFPDSLIRFQENLGINMCFMLLIFMGGLGFGVLMEISGIYRPGGAETKKLFYKAKRLSWHSRMVFSTSLILILAGWVFLLISEPMGELKNGLDTHLLVALFQSVTSRTAGFNTVEIGYMTNTSLLVLILLMFIGGSPASCAGGIKTTTFRSLFAFVWSSLVGRRQVVLGNFALNWKTLNKVMTILVFSVVTILVAVFVIMLIEVGKMPHPETHGMFLEVLFESVSAFATVGLSTGITPELSNASKIVIIFLMFTGRLGIILLLSVLHNWQKTERFSWPEDSLLVG